MNSAPGEAAARTRAVERPPRQDGSPEAAGARAIGAAPGVNIWRGLLWREWLAHRNAILVALVAWLVLGWVLLIFCHPGFIIAFGVLFAILAGPGFGGLDAAEGSEEFAFSLPPTRSQRYLARLAVGGGAMLAMTILGVLTIALDLPQRLWGLVVETGFTEPFPAARPAYLYAYAIAIPWAAFAFTFALASNFRSRAAMSWFLGLVLTGTIVLAGSLLEQLLWDRMTGLLVWPSLLALGVMALLAGYLVYQRKEGVSRPTPMGGASRGWIIALIIAIIIVLLLVFFAWFARGVYHEERASEVRQQAGPHAERVAPGSQE